MILIDGAVGEGGGQILRTSLSLSMVTGIPFQIDRIRAGRQRPGLLRQHLTSVLAAAEVSGAQVEGAAMGSTTLTFSPGPVRPGSYRFAVGTAGSGTLVFQTILPALMLADRPSQITIEGGTHNQAAPPYDFLARTFLPLIGRMGPKVYLRLERYGFYPQGGGRFVARIEPVGQLVPLRLGDHGEISSRRISAVVANLPAKIAQREVDAAAGVLGWEADSCAIEEIFESDGPGNVVMVEIRSQAVTEICTAFGQKGVSAEKVAESAAHEALAYLTSPVAVGQHLADQLLLPMALSGGGSFTTSNLNLHARTNIEVIARFLPIRFESSIEADGHHIVKVVSCS